MNTPMIERLFEAVGLTVESIEPQEDNRVVVTAKPMTPEELAETRGGEPKEKNDAV